MASSSTPSNARTPAQPQQPPASVISTSRGRRVKPPAGFSGTPDNYYVQLSSFLDSKVPDGLPEGLPMAGSGKQKDLTKSSSSLHPSSAAAATASITSSSNARRRTKEESSTTITTTTTTKAKSQTSGFGVTLTPSKRRGIDGGADGNSDMMDLDDGIPKLVDPFPDKSADFGNDLPKGNIVGSSFEGVDLENIEKETLDAKLRMRDAYFRMEHARRSIAGLKKSRPAPQDFESLSTMEEKKRFHQMRRLQVLRMENLMLETEIKEREEAADNLEHKSRNVIYAELCVELDKLADQFKNGALPMIDQDLVHSLKEGQSLEAELTSRQGLLKELKEEVQAIRGCERMRSTIVEEIEKLRSTLTKFISMKFPVERNISIANTSEPPMLLIFQSLLEKVDQPDPYITIEEGDPGFEKAAQFLIKAKVAQLHPEDRKMIRLVPFHRRELPEDLLQALQTQAV
ncbi:hypothetical protein HDU76_013327 [Blyttiomyces sp. JEL0837]|nr:hypothetical protein HDU76_013327 [Blyttiomyces sp. JEL0837]